MIAPHLYEPASDADRDPPASRAHPPEATTESLGWSRRVRVVVSLLLVLHLAAIVSAPWAMAPSSELAQRVFSFFQPYVDLAFLNHGYHFFAPEPGPSHVIRYELQCDDGRRITGQFPDANVHSPRLLYHRHFMLTETANRLAVDPNQRAALDSLSRSFADHLLTQYSASRATLYLRRHYIPTPEQVASGLPLDAPELFAERPLGTFDAFRGREQALQPALENTHTRATPESLRPAATLPVAARTQGAVR